MRLLLAARVVAVATKLRQVSGFLAMFTAVLAVWTVGRYDAGTRRMRTFFGGGSVVHNGSLVVAELSSCCCALIFNLQFVDDLLDVRHSRHRLLDLASNSLRHNRTRQRHDGCLHGVVDIGR